MQNSNNNNNNNNICLTITLSPATNSSLVFSNASFSRRMTAVEKNYARWPLWFEIPSVFYTAGRVRGRVSAFKNLCNSLWKCGGWL